MIGQTVSNGTLTGEVIEEIRNHGLPRGYWTTLKVKLPDGTVQEWDEKDILPATPSSEEPSKAE